MRATALAFLCLATCAARPKPRPAPPAPAAASAECESDADCVVTLLSPGGCCGGCALLVRPKAQVDAQIAKCGEAAKRCPALPCAPPRFQVRPACVRSRCEAVTERRE